MTMTAPQIRQTLDNWLAPGATLPSRGCLNYLKISWAKLKPNLLPSYHPIIDDRIAEVEIRLKRVTTIPHELYNVHTEQVEAVEDITPAEAAGRNTDLRHRGERCRWIPAKPLFD